MKVNVLISAVILGAMACASPQQKEEREAPQSNIKSIEEKVDSLSSLVLQQIPSSSLVATLDHHRMAQEKGVYTPASIAIIYSDAEINTTLIKENPLIGLDLPFKLLCYSEPDTSQASLAYTSSEFIQKRHSLDPKQLVEYQARLNKVIQNIDTPTLSESDLSKVESGFGIIQIKSDFNYEQTINRLKEIVNAQNDTKWFGEIDYQKEAEQLSVTISPATLLLFGGPAPGGKAMQTTPKIGLDAFCQKLLVYENTNGEVYVAFNDIVAFSQLYYNSATKPQKMINQRLIATFTQAVSTSSSSE